MRIIGYCRVSTDKQREDNTVEIQRHALAEYAHMNGHKLEAIFSDEGVSGGLENRPALSDMMGYLDSHPTLEGVLIFKLDRLARDVRIQENLIYDLQERKGIRILSIKEPDLASKEPDRVLHRQILGAFSQYERSLITMRLTLGRLKKARSGGYSGGQPAYGYRAQNSDLTIDERQAETVREIYRMKRHRKMGLNAIARTLNQMAIPTSRGMRWHSSTVRYILGNTVYKGVLRYKGTEAVRSELALLQ